MAEGIRSFVAFDLENESVLKRITEAQALLVKTGADLRLVEPQNIHMTLRFLGNITLGMVDKIHEEMKKVQFVPFDVKLRGLGAFPDVRYPRVCWAGITEGADQLRSIFSQLEPRLRGLGFAPDPKGFSPHLTIARVRSARNKVDLAKCISTNMEYEFGQIRARCLRLKKSDLTPRGPIYSVLREVCL
ncbi:MAG: RNA 2',3'-cyclic phosphodiesterase [Candidatus Bathyarchaeia archaeon]